MEVPEKLSRYNAFMKKSVERIFNALLDDQSWSQAALHVSRGRLGIRGTEMVALPAYFALAYLVSSVVSQIFLWAGKTG